MHFTSRIQRIFRLVVLFCVLRVAAGLAAILLFDRDAMAWGVELTLIVVAMLAIYLLVALAVRRWAPPRPAAR
jgi:hypothetical protein